MSNHFCMTTIDTNYQKLVFDEQPLFDDDYQYKLSKLVFDEQPLFHDDSRYKLSKISFR